MPQLGESIAEATIIAFNVSIGDEVECDQDALEVETQKAVMGVTSPCSGRVVEWSAQIQQSYAVGEILGFVECTLEEAQRLGLDGVIEAARSILDGTVRGRIVVEIG
jgi:pyruvate/2-oxoglutarate dehydrogenase complex dihydrolipoamide acyltransferase (E2) component